MITEWLGASLSSLREVWDNEEDAIYDHPDIVRKIEPVGWKKL